MSRSRMFALLVLQGVNDLVREFECVQVSPQCSADLSRRYDFNGAEKSFVYTAPSRFKSLLNRYTESTRTASSESIVAASSARRIFCASAADASCRTRPIVRCGEIRAFRIHTRAERRRIRSRATTPPALPWSPTHKTRARFTSGKEPMPPTSTSNAGTESACARRVEVSAST